MLVMAHAGDGFLIPGTCSYSAPHNSLPQSARTLSMLLTPLATPKLKRNLTAVSHGDDVNVAPAGHSEHQTRSRMLCGGRHSCMLSQ